MNSEREWLPSRKELELAMFSLYLDLSFSFDWGNTSSPIFEHNNIIPSHMAIEDEISPWTIGMHLSTLLLIYAYIKE